MDLIGNDWDELLQDEYKKEYFKNLLSEVDKEYREYEIYPPRENIFDALKYTSYADTKVVIVGQDPYINPGQAHGLSFSVNPGANIPPSLINIFKELKDDVGCYIPNNGCLIPWAKQGVLLLNSILTVRRGISKSHKNIGWEKFTDAIMEILNKKDSSLIFMLWGNDAKRKGSIIDENSHMVLKSVHPSPLAGNAFLGCRHFSKANEYLYETTMTAIDWQIPDIKM